MTHPIHYLCISNCLIIYDSDRKFDYIMSLPLHHSQRLLVDEGDYAEFEVKVAPTEEFFMEMLHGGSWIEVLSPKEVVDQMKGWVEDLYNVYNK